MQNSKEKTLSQRIAERIIKYILEENLQPGDKLPLDIGNLSVMQIDIPNKKIVREKYIAAQSDKKTYLTKTLQF